MKRAHLAAALACAPALWVALAFPWTEPVPCLRSGPLALRALSAAGDLGIWVPYTVMPVVLVGAWRRMRARPEASLLALYGSFILLCGLTHLTGAAVLLSPLYWVAAKLKVTTALVSVAVMVVTVAKRQAIVDLGESGAALAREAESARRAKADADEHAAGALRARAELALANQALSEINARLDRERAEEASRAQRAETRNLDLESALRKISAQDEALRTLESPILEALDGVLVSVLVGGLTSERAADWTQRLVEHAHRKRARVVVVDVTGLTLIDTAVADAILRTVAALRILGSACLMTGVRPEVAQTIVGLGVDLQGLQTLPTLRQGLERAAHAGR